MAGFCHVTVALFSPNFFTLVWNHFSSFLAFCLSSCQFHLRVMFFGVCSFIVLFCFIDLKALILKIRGTSWVSCQESHMNYEKVKWWLATLAEFAVPRCAWTMVYQTLIWWKPYCGGLSRCCFTQIWGNIAFFSYLCKIAQRRLAAMWFSSNQGSTPWFRPWHSKFRKCCQPEFSCSWAGN